MDPDDNAGNNVEESEELFVTADEFNVGFLQSESFDLDLADLESPLDPELFGAGISWASTPENRESVPPPATENEKILPNVEREKREKPPEMCAVGEEAAGGSTSPVTPRYFPGYLCRKLIFRSTSTESSASDDSGDLLDGFGVAGKADSDDFSKSFDSRVDNVEDLMSPAELAQGASPFFREFDESNDSAYFADDEMSGMEEGSMILLGGSASGEEDAVRADEREPADEEDTDTD